MSSRVIIYLLIDGGTATNVRLLINFVLPVMVGGELHE